MSIVKFDIRTTIVILSFLGFGSIGSIFMALFKVYDWYGQVNESIERIDNLEKEKEELILLFKKDLSKIDKRTQKDSIYLDKIDHWMHHYDEKYNDGLKYYLR